MCVANVDRKAEGQAVRGVLAADRAGRQSGGGRLGGPASRSAAISAHDAALCVPLALHPTAEYRCSHSNSTAEAVGANRPRTRRSRDAVRRASRRCRDASCVIRSLRLSSPHPLLPPCREMGQPAQARHYHRRRRRRKVRRRRRHHRWRSRRLPLLAVEAAAARSNAGCATGLCRRASYVPSWTSGESLARDVRRLSRSSR